MKTLKFSDLGAPVREFLNRQVDDESVCILDDQGVVRYNISGFRETAPETESRAQAWSEIKAIQELVGERMLALGITEEDIDRVLAEDD